LIYVDDVHGAQNISNHFKNSYGELYNEQDNIDEELVDEVKSDIANNIDQSKDYIQLLDADLVKAAIKKLKNDKCDYSGNFTSDCLKSAPYFSYLN
jgi:hypothetical protein